MKGPLIKIYGERNSGTNYLYHLLNLNFDVKVLPGAVPSYLHILQKYLPGHELLPNAYFHLFFPVNLGWKHSLVKPVDVLRQITICSKQLSFITITKNPYSWALSLFKHPYHYNYRFKILKDPIHCLLSLFKRPYHYTVKNWTFEEFLMSIWPTTSRENSPKEFANPIDMWNQKNGSYRQLKTAFRTLNLRYEDLLLDPEGVLRQVADAFSLPTKHDQFKNVIRSTKGENKHFAFYQQYYLKEKWKEELTAESINIINKYLDSSLLKYFRYEKIG